MFKRTYATISIHFLVWFSGITFILFLQLVLSLKEFGFKEPIQVSLYLRYLLLNLAWIVSLSLPLSGLFSSSSAYISGLLDRRAQDIHHDGKTQFSGLASFLAPAAALGFSVALICLAMCLFVVPSANLRSSNLAEFMKTGTATFDGPQGDREMSVGQLLERARQLSLESSHASVQKKIEMNLKRNRLMVEVYKKFALPLLGFLLPILGGLMALILSKRRSGQRTILFLFNIFLLILIWVLLIAGEAWGDRGILPPFASMFLTPLLAIIIIVALLKRCGEILASTEAVHK
jgi:hypothetical protein